MNGYLKAASQHRVFDTQCFPNGFSNELTPDIVIRACLPLAMAYGKTNQKQKAIKVLKMGIRYAEEFHMSELAAPLYSQLAKMIPDDQRKHLIFEKAKEIDKERFDKNHFTPSEQNQRNTPKNVIVVPLESASLPPKILEKTVWDTEKILEKINNPSSFPPLKSSQSATVTVKKTIPQTFIDPSKEAKKTKPNEISWWECDNDDIKHYDNEVIKNRPPGP